MVCLAPRAPGDSVRPRRPAGVVVRPLNFTVRGPFVTPHQIVAVALRLFAVWIGIQTLRTLPAFLTMTGSDTPGYVWMTFMLALNAVIVFVLWVFPRTIAGKLLPPPEAQPQPLATPDLWLSMGCTLMGLWILTTTIPRLAYELFAWDAMSYTDDRSQLHRSLFYYVLELAIALWLILGAKGVRKLFWWAQNAAVRKDL